VSKTCCLYRIGVRCSMMPKILGVVKRKCIYVTNVPCYKCHLQIEEFDDRDYLAEHGVIK